jgi:uncharacterized repeat protein (TIGR01451 family)
MAQLPDFAGPRAFHGAFIFNRPSDGHDLLCVAGGTDVNSVAYANTECYDFDGQTCPTCADLAITKDNGQTDVTPGTMVTYTITVDNIGPNDVVGAMVDDMFPPEFTGVTWTCSGTGGGTCTASGAGDIADMVDIPVMGQVVYMATGLVGGGTLLENTATVSLPVEFIEIDPANNTSTDSDPIVGQGDLWVVKTSDLCAYLPGDTVTYTITVGNAGPDDVDGTVTDAFPADLTGVTWTCAATGAATCTASGAGDISDPVVLPFGDTVTYTAVGVIDMGTVATSLSNTASVSSIFFDPDMTNNSWTDTVPLELPIFCDGFESGDTLMWSSTVP